MLFVVYVCCLLFSVFVMCSVLFVGRSWFCVVGCVCCGLFVGVLCLLSPVSCLVCFVCVSCLALVCCYVCFVVVWLLFVLCRALFIVA